MSNERYVGERRALWHFLSELRPLVVAALGEDALLRHQIDRALKSGDLDRLRDARRNFHSHPEALKRQLMRGIFEGADAGNELPTIPPDDSVAPADDGAEPTSKHAGAIRFDAVLAAAGQDVGLSVDLDSGSRDMATVPVQVMIEPGTLPRSAAEALRQIADWIEHDRRLLSRQHWERLGHRRTPSDETVDQA